MLTHQDTIAAIVTSPGTGGVGIIRVSGGKVRMITNLIFNIHLKPRLATLRKFYNSAGKQLDEVLLLFFPNPHSFTGEDVLEIQGHGGTVLLELMLREILKLGARQARPGEFSERAFLNGKIDLVQAEAIADLIEGKTEKAVIAANRSLQGEFSNKINQILLALTRFRVYIEAAIDFPEEEIDFLADKQVREQFDQLSELVHETLETAAKGAVIREGIEIAIIGEPNAGKSSLLNKLAGQDMAIVTEIPGTTRDVISVTIQIQGVPFCLKDTAGIRESSDPVEKIGIYKAKQTAKESDCTLLIIDSANSKKLAKLRKKEISNKKIIIFNKIDLLNKENLKELRKEFPDEIYLSTKTGQGINTLEQKLFDFAGGQFLTTGVFSARQRHVIALGFVKDILKHCEQLIVTKQGELVAEELRQAQQVLGEITGQVTTEELLEKIFSSFCIGK